MKKILMLCSLFTIVLSYSCKDNTTEPPVPPETKYEPLIPISEGNYWLYREYTLMSENYEGGDSNSSKYGFIISKLPIQLTTKLDTSNYVMYRCRENLTIFDDSQYIQVGGNHLVYQNENGFYYTGKIRKDSLVQSFKDLIFPNQAVKGKKTSGRVFYYSTIGNYMNIPDNANTEYTCISTDSLLSTPAGDFSCVVYKAAFEDVPPLFRGDVYYFIKPGIGIVGMIQTIYYYSTKKYIYAYKTLLTDYKIWENKK